MRRSVHGLFSPSILRGPGLSDEGALAFALAPLFPSGMLLLPNVSDLPSLLLPYVSLSVSTPSVSDLSHLLLPSLFSLVFDLDDVFKFV